MNRIAFDVIDDDFDPDGVFGADVRRSRIVHDLSRIAFRLRAGGTASACRVSSFYSVEQWAADHDEVEWPRIVFVHAPKTYRWRSVVSLLADSPGFVATFSGDATVPESIADSLATYGAVHTSHSTGVKTEWELRHTGQAGALAGAVGWELRELVREHLLALGFDVAGLPPAMSKSTEGHRDGQLGSRSRHALTNALVPALLSLRSIEELSGSADEALGVCEAMVSRVEEKESVVPIELRHLCKGALETLRENMELGEPERGAAEALKLLEAARHRYSASLDVSVGTEAADRELVEFIRRNLEKAPRILWLDDDEAWSRAGGTRLRAQGFTVCFFSSPEDFLVAAASQAEPALALVDLELGGERSGFKILREIARSSPLLVPAVLSADGRASTMRRAALAGARDYFCKSDVSISDLGPRLANLLLKFTEQDDHWRPAEPDLLVAHGDPLLSPLRTLSRLLEVDRDGPYLLVGETGVGKEYLARELHLRSGRRGELPHTFNCGTVTAGLLESELFGHLKGSFTGADTSRAGVCDEAQGGTLLLDEVDKLPVEHQPALLRLLGERVYRPVGSNEYKELDCLIVVTSNVAPDADDGVFIQPLSGRIREYEMHVPSLRERAPVVPVLARQLLARLCQEFGREAVLQDDAAALLSELAAQGLFSENFRQLRRLLKQCLLAGEDAADGVVGPATVRRFLHGLGPPSEFEASPIGEVAAELIRQLESTGDPLVVVQERLRAAIYTELVRTRGMEKQQAAALVGKSRQAFSNDLRSMKQEGLVDNDL